MDVVAVLDTAIDVARAMEHLHSQNIVHSGELTFTHLSFLLHVACACVR